MRIITAIMFLVCGGFVYAQQVEIGVVPREVEGIVRSQLQAREAPPHGPLNLFVGQQVGTIEAGDKIKILAKKTYGGFSGDHVWYQIETTSQPGRPSTPAWVYGGVEGKDPRVQINKIIK